MDKKRIEEHVRKVLSFALLDYSFNLHFRPDDKEEDGRNVEAEVTVDNRYLKADIEIYPILLTRSEKHIKHALTHELSHIITQPLYDLIFQVAKSDEEITNAWETTTERIAKIITRSL